MASGGRRLLAGKVEIDGTVTGAGACGNRKKKLIQIVIDRKDKGISRMYAKGGQRRSGGLGTPLVEKKVCKTAVSGRTGHSPLKKDFPNLVQERGGEKRPNFPEIHRAITVVKGDPPFGEKLCRLTWTNILTSPTRTLWEGKYSKT